MRRHGTIRIALLTMLFVAASRAEVSPQPPDTERAPKESGRARVRLFGLVGEGYKFVFVFDRSGSMGGDGRAAIKAVKAELCASLESLSPVHQFQIVFYNERPRIFNPAGTPDRLPFATEENKRRAERFLESMTADGGTDHEAALRQAIRLHPDVIFWMSDADEPRLKPSQMDAIRRLAAGIILHAIEFGPGPKPAGDSFLAQTARQNGGGYVYVDLSQSPTKPANR